MDYKIINENRLLKNKCEIEIQLFKKATKDELVNISNNLYQENDQNFEFFHISFYLQSQSPDTDDAWAVAIFNPNLRIMMGLTVTNESLLKDRISPIANKKGEWIDHIQNGAKYTLGIEDSKFILAIDYPESKGYKLQLIESSDGEEKKYKDILPNEANEFYIINSDGDLELYDEDGLIRTLPKIG